VIAPNASSMLIGGSHPPPGAALFASSGNGNLISGNGSHGILLEHTTEAVLMNNYIGVPRSSSTTIPMGNRGDGIRLVDTRLTHIEGGLIGGNLGNGISILGGNAARNAVINVGIGVTEDGAATAGNGGHGISIGRDSHQNFIGVAEEIAAANGNTIAGNRGYGIHIETGADDTTVIGNTISSGGGGIRIVESSGNLVANNVIHAGAVGVQVTGVNNTVRENTISVEAEGLRIDLGGDGASPNDRFDLDDGANGLLNAPGLKSAAIQGDAVMVRGQYEGAPEIAVRIELFADDLFVQAFEIITDRKGQASFGVDLPVDFREDHFSATATSAGNTSEYSGEVVPRIPPVVRGIGAKVGAPPRVELVDAATGDTIFDAMAYGRSFKGGVRVATGDVNGDGFQDLIATPGGGTKPKVKVYSGVDGELMSSFLTGSRQDVGARTIAVRDIDGDGGLEIVVGQASSAGSYVAVYDALTGDRELLRRPFGVGYTGFIRLQLSDIDGDSVAEIIARGTTAGMAFRRIIHL
jgi:parallel beta-helix repeat protein